MCWQIMSLLQLHVVTRSCESRAHYSHYFDMKRYASELPATQWDSDVRWDKRHYVSLVEQFTSVSMDYFTHKDRASSPYLCIIDGVQLH